MKMEDSLQVLYEQINEPLCKFNYYYSTFANFNECEHFREIHYYSPNGYMVKFFNEAILRSVLACHDTKSNTYVAKCRISIRNINCKRKSCRNTCHIDGLDGNILVRYKEINDKKCVVNYWCETDYPNFFEEEFYDILKSLSKECNNNATLLQNLMCSRKRVWIGDHLINILYNLFCNGYLLVQFN